MKNPRTKILFDAVALAQLRPTGVGRAAAGLIQAIAEAHPDDVELVGHYFDFLGRKQGRVGLPMAPNIRYRRTVLLPGKVFNMLRRLRVPVFFELLIKERGDFILFPNYIGWPSLFRTPSAPYVHDATYIELPEYVNRQNLFDLRTLMPGTFHRSSFTITDTESSRSGIQRAYPEYEKPFVIAHIPLVGAAPIANKQATQVIEQLGVTKPYILFFGTLEPRKNLIGLLDAYRALSNETRGKYSLVIGGGKGWNDDEIVTALQSAKDSGLNVIETGYVTDDQRGALFTKASLYIMPSFYEGFGMPLLEAMFYKTPIIASNIAVLKEVAGDAALFCDTSPESISETIAKLLNNKPMQKNLVENGTKRLKHFTWEKVAADVFAAIEKSLGR